MPPNSVFSLKHREHHDHRNLPAPSTQFVYPEIITRQEQEQSLQAHLGQFHAAAAHRDGAADDARNHKSYFMRRAELERNLENSARTMLSHMNRNLTAKAASFNSLSHAKELKRETPADIDFGPIERDLFIGTALAEDRDRQKLYLPIDSRAPAEYFKYANGRTYDQLTDGMKTEMKTCLQKTILESDAHHQVADNESARGASSTQQSQSIQGTVHDTAPGGGDNAFWGANFSPQFAAEEATGVGNWWED